MALRSYLSYLDSPEWWAIRRQAMRRARFRCERERPGETRHEGALELHHRHYRTLGFETLEDVEVTLPLVSSGRADPAQSPENAARILWTATTLRPLE